MDYSSTLKYREQEYTDIGKLKVSLKDVYKVIEREDLRYLLDEIEYWIKISIADKFDKISIDNIKEQWFVNFLDKKNKEIIYLNCDEYRIIFEIKEKWYSRKQYIEITLEHLNNKITIQ